MEGKSTFNIITIKTHAWYKIKRLLPIFLKNCLSISEGIFKKILLDAEIQYSTNHSRNYKSNLER